MLVISILEANDFGDELYPVMRKSITDIIHMQHVGLVIAAGDSKGMIYRLLSELAVEYPHIFFTILLSNDELAYEGSEERWPQIISFDGDLVYPDPKNAKKTRREILIERSDIVFCLKGKSNGIRKINSYCDIMTV